MRWFVFLGGLLAMFHKLPAFVYDADVYSGVMQTFVERETFKGDRQGQFQGNDVAILSDGSEWKIHPDSEKLFQTWQAGDVVHVTVRSDWYWFKREHKFALCNDTQGGFVKAMLVEHKKIPLQIVAVDTYFKSQRKIYIPVTTFSRDASGQMVPHTYYHYSGCEPTEPRKVISLSDGSIWVIKDKFKDFSLGMNVYLGAQGTEDRFYDFVLISGKEREAVWTWARAQK